jgi:6-phosphogluconolactonase/glucosamine-6-phosphate isomerase/deaminase
MKPYCQENARRIQLLTTGKTKKEMIKKRLQITEKAIDGPVFLL